MNKIRQLFKTTVSAQASESLAKESAEEWRGKIQRNHKRPTLRHTKYLTTEGV